MSHPPSPLEAKPATAPSRHQRLAPLLAVLTLLTGVATLRSLLLPPWPRAAALPPQASLQAVLQQAGIAARPLPPKAAVRQAERFLSEGWVWQLEGGEILQLRHGAMRRWEDIQLAGLTRGIPDLALQQRQLRQRGGLPLAIGTVNGDRTRQTCLVSGIAAPKPVGVTYRELSELLSQRAIPVRERIESLLGLVPPRRYDCVLISLQAVADQPLDAKTWDRLLEGLVPALRDVRAESPNL